MVSVAGALRAIRRGRDKSAYYRMWHLRQRAGFRYPDDPAPGAALPFETALLALGKESGALDDCLRLLAEYFQAEDRLMLRVLRHAAYPMFTALAAALIGPLPLAFGGHVVAYVVTASGGALLWAAAGGGMLAAITARFLQRPTYVLGRLLRALTIAVEAGLGLDRAVVLAAEASGSGDVMAHVRRRSAHDLLTRPLSETFAGCPCVPGTALAAMRVAEASGDYSGTLRKLAELYE